jgi:hypothetical protein
MPEQRGLFVAVAEQQHPERNLPLRWINGQVSDGTAA